MARFGKPDATGRSSGVRTGRKARQQKPPEGEPWVWQTLGLLQSPVIRKLSLNGWRTFNFLLVEHGSHAGQCNGELRATYDQLAEYAGIPRKHVRAALFELESMGLVRTTFRGGRNCPSRYRLTFYGTEDGPATNEWKRVTTIEAQAVADEVIQLKAQASGRKAFPIRVPTGGGNLDPP